MTKGSPLSGRDPKDSERTTINVTDGTLIPSRDEGGLLSAWNISFFGAVGLLVALPLISPDPYLRILSFVPDGLIATFSVTLSSIFFALIIGLFAGLGRVSQNKAINRVSTIYVEIIRAYPFSSSFSISITPSAPAQTRDRPPPSSPCRSAMVPTCRNLSRRNPGHTEGQMEAALALGMSRATAREESSFPDGEKNPPPIGNEFIALLKDSSLVSILAVSDLLRRGREYASTSFRYFESYTVIALIYLVMTLFFSRLVAMMEEKLRHRGNVH